MVSQNNGVPAGLKLGPPAVGTTQLTILTPNVLELLLVNTETQGSAPAQWNFVSNGTLSLPATSKFTVSVNGSTYAISGLAFKRRPLWATESHRDLRIGNYLYLTLSQAVPSGATVTVTNPDQSLFTSSQKFSATADPNRLSPALHVNQEGYMASLNKKAQVGYYMGSGGDMPVPSTNGFTLIDDNGATCFSGQLTARPEQGSPFTPAPYQAVYQADFSSFQTPGHYRLQVPGMGVSYPFYINDELGGDFARAYALGIYSKRCGTALTLPFTRFIHDICHTNPVQIPDLSSTFATTQQLLNNFVQAAQDPYQTAQQMTDTSKSLFPFVDSGTVDVHGGHHDAGDYSKYVIDCAQFVHHLVFAVDNIPGVAALDNLGIPESGDGKSDLLQEAQWEADYLCRNQDQDGGFFFLTYPRDESYEWNVVPGNTVPQVAYPKNIPGTAACTAALYEIATSPTFKAQFPQDAANCLAHADLGYKFLQNAFNKYGRVGSYQTITFYGCEFSDLDEIAWAEVEEYIAHGDAATAANLANDLQPLNPNESRWTWWRLFESYGCATRDYAFAQSSGRTLPSPLNATLVSQCQQQIHLAGQDQLNYVTQSAYGAPYAYEDKHYGNASWFLSGDRAFDMVVDNILNPSPAYVDAIVSSINYENGSNPVNVSYITGQGWKRQINIVDQQSVNERQTMPVSGIGLGQICNVEPVLPNYGQTELRDLTFPSDADNTNPYAMYDRWTDTWNVENEIVTSLQARGLASTAYLMTLSNVKSQSWQSANATLTLPSGGVVVNQPNTVTLTAAGLDLSQARIVWEASGENPQYGGATLTYTPAATGAAWIEAEAQWPDGRRVFATADFSVVATGSNPSPSPTATSTPSPTPTATSTPTPTPTATSTPTPTPTATSTPTPTPTATSTPTPTPTATSTPTPTPTATSTPTPSPSPTGTSDPYKGQTTYPVTTASFNMSGTIKSLNGGTVGVSSYGITTSIPYYQATFYVNGRATAFASLRVGQAVSVTVKGFNGTLLSVSMVTVKLNSPQGWVIVPAQVLPSATNNQIYVNVTQGTRVTLTTMKSALGMTNVASIVNAPHP
jgi:hypothetical protein